VVGDILLVVNHAHAWPGVGIGIGRNNMGVVWMAVRSRLTSGSVIVDHGHTCNQITCGNSPVQQLPELLMQRS